MTEHVLSVMTAFSVDVEMDIDELLERATRDWHSDDGGSPYQVLAHVPEECKFQVRETLRRPDVKVGEDFLCWRFQREEEITALCTFLQYFPQVSYWGITKAG